MSLLHARRGGTRNKFWGGLQSFIIYACAIHEFIKKNKTKFSTKLETESEINLLKKNQNGRRYKGIYEKVRRAVDRTSQHLVPSLKNSEPSFHP